MSTEPQLSRTHTTDQTPRDRSAAPTAPDADERADVEEDRRRQRQLDDEELGGEG